MILYLDASALVKRYTMEHASVEVRDEIARADLIGTAVVSRAEVAAALSKAVRLDALTQDEGASLLQVFRTDWPKLARIHITELVVARADELAWTHNLRGFDAVHLAAALTWQDALDARVTLATFDRCLWAASQESGLEAYPTDLSALLKRWKSEDQAGPI